jgi:hypothetical protein
MVIFTFNDVYFILFCVQIYELLAGSTSERSKWIKHITEASNPHKSKDGMSKTKVGQILTSYWSIKQPIMSMDLFTCQHTQVQGGHVQDQGRADPHFLLINKAANHMHI